MQWLAQICVRRPVFTWVVILVLAVAGSASVLGLGVDRFPNVDFPALLVMTRYDGASPAQVETEVTEPIEEALNSVAGLDLLASNSFEGLSLVVAQFTLETPGAVAAQDVRDRVNRALPLLPRGIDLPRVERIDPDAAPVLQIAVTSSRSVREATDFAERVIKRRIESLDGVGGVSIQGGREREIQVILDAEKLASVGLTARDVQRALAMENVELPGGQVEEGRSTVQLRVQGRIATPGDFATIPLREHGDRVVHVGDVASVVDAEEPASSAATLNGDGVVIVSVRKQSGTNTVAVVDALRERITEIRAALPPSYQMEIVRDESEYIRNSIAAVKEHLIGGSVLAALVVLLFLWNGRSTLIAALAIPTSIITTFVFIRALGLTLNMITLLGLTLAVGIVIDDAIVVLENIVRWIEERGVPAKKAAVLATREIGLAVLATTLSLVAVFMPIAFMGGIVGRFMGSFGYTMSFAILVSLFVSFTLTPMLCSRWLKEPRTPIDPKRLEEEEAAARREAEALEIPDPPPGDRGAERAEYLAWMRGERTAADAGHLAAARRGVYGRLEAGYLRLLAWCMRHRWAMGLALAGSLVAIVPLGAAVPKNFLPDEDESRFDVTIRAPEGTALAQTQLVCERIARDIRKIPGVAATVLTVGSPPGDPSGRGPNQASLYVQLAPPGDRAEGQTAIMERVRREVMPRYRHENLRTIVAQLNPFGANGAAAAPIQYVLSGPDLVTLGGYARRMLEEVRKIPGITDPDITLVEGSPSYEVRIDRARAADLGVSIADISNTLRLMVGGVEVTNYSEGGERYDVRVRAEGDFRSSPEVIAQTTVPTALGRSVRLSDVASIARATGPASIQHLARERQVTVYAATLPGASEAAVIEQFGRISAALRMEPGYRATLTGRSRELGRTMQAFLVAVVLAFVFMYLVLSAQFESWLHPITILSSLPLTVPFALLSLVAFGQSLNIYSMLGILVLFGIVKKNAILQIDHMRDLRRKGFSRADAVMIGNRDRLRPILMTTLAFVAGMLPLLVSTGAGSGVNHAIGAVVAGGQTLALLLTLLATPVVYSWLDDLSGARLRWFKRARSHRS